MYIEIGAFDTKAKLSQLLQGIKHGRRYTITLRGIPVADLIPTENSSQNANNAIDAMRNIHKIRGISAENINEWINEGRK